jgi:hypothetical protein
LYEAGKRLGVRTPAQATPSEYHLALRVFLSDLQKRGRFLREISAAEGALDLLADIYIRQLYAGELPGEQEKLAGIRSLRRLRTVILLARAGIMKT